MTDSAPANTPATFHASGYVKNGKWHFGNPAAILGGRVFWFISNGVFAIAVGVGLAIFVNWIVGLFVFSVIVAICWNSRKHYGLWRGDCPHCAHAIGIAHGSGGQHAFDCPICKRRAFLTGGEFRAV